MVLPGRSATVMDLQSQQSQEQQKLEAVVQQITIDQKF
jgi:hypothetical protein